MLKLNVGFIGFGEVAAALTSWLNRCDIKIYTSLENRSIQTMDRARKLDVQTYKSNQDLAENSDILISSVTPAYAVNIAKEVGNYVRGIYVDVNNISPQTALESLKYIKNGKTVDAAIMGGVKNGNQTLIVASGRCAEKFAELNSYGLNIKVLGPELGRAKTLKMLRSQYTKGISALLFESFLTAYKFGLDEELLGCLELTEGPEFCKSAASRITSSITHAQRRSEEMEEIIKFIKSSDIYENGYPEMVEAAQSVFRYISRTYDGTAKPEGYKEALKFFKKP